MEAFHSESQYISDVSTENLQYQNSVSNKEWRKQLFRSLVKSSGFSSTDTCILVQI